LPAAAALLFGLPPARDKEGIFLLFVILPDGTPWFAAFQVFVITPVW